MSIPQVSDGTSISNARSPSASRSIGSAPGPPLCPGTCNLAGDRRAYSVRASRYGASRWLGSTAAIPARSSDTRCLSATRPSLGEAAGRERARHGVLRRARTDDRIHGFATPRELPAAERDYRLASLQRQGDLRERAELAAHRDQRIG